MGPTVRRLRGRLGPWVAAVVGLWAAALAANRSLRRVRGRSMADTLLAGDLVLTLPVRDPRRGEVVLVRDPGTPSRVQVKRVVGLPGERVELRHGVLWLDGRRHDEPYRQGRGPDGGLRVPPDHVVVLGDARAASTDSRTYGPVPRALVLRRVPARLWPRPAWLPAAPRPVADGECRDDHIG